MGPSSVFLIALLCISCINGLKLQVVTIATEETDGYKRFMAAAEHFDIQVEVVGMGQEWKGGPIRTHPGGGFKILLLRPVLERWKDREDLLIMFVDSYDVVFNAGADVIIKKFLEFNSRTVFSAEQFCWPDKSLASVYPKVGLGKRFLCSGGFIGYAADIYNVVTDHEITEREDDQLYYTKLYLDQDTREKYGMRLDHRSHIFQNLNGAQDEIELELTRNETYAYNSLYQTSPTVFHGNGLAKIFLNFLGNYIPDRWTEELGCVHCAEERITLPPDQEEWPTVVLGLFVEQPTPFLPQMLAKVQGLEYPKEKMSLWIHNQVEHHEEFMSQWAQDVQAEYQSVVYVDSAQGMSEASARSTAMSYCVEEDCNYYFAVDSVVMLDEPKTLRWLIETNRSVLVPLLQRPGQLWSNFWGNIADDGFYARSRDYHDIVQRNRVGVWNVPYVAFAVLFQGSWLKKRKDHLPEYASTSEDPDMAFCTWMRNEGHFMYVTNIQTYGHLVNPDNYETHHLHNDLYNLFKNRKDWEEKYIHKDHHKNLLPDKEIDMPCPDVYWFPFVTDIFAKELIEELENYGGWSSGKNEDSRLDGGYENVPTVDIHMTQVGFQEHWLEVLRTYIVPIQIKVYPGYYSKANAHLNFVVKYHPKGQYLLRPHHDSSTFTLNVALSRPGIDYEGGGCRFIRYNCSVVDTKLGWALMHPGRLTHFHEGLTVTSGTRYIMVSFVDP